MCRTAARPRLPARRTQCHSARVRIAHRPLRAGVQQSGQARPYQTGAAVGDSWRFPLHAPRAHVYEAAEFCGLSSGGCEAEPASATFAANEALPAASARAVSLATAAVNASG